MIKVEHLSKEYLIRHNSAAKYSSLRDELMSKVRGVFRKDESKTMERFMALNDVSFEVNQGDRVGIIGRNGAGKSTLLKVLSRIVTPTSGKITIEGRVASLLEVGTGFHPELTGRENIFLNGSILGMSREEIRSKFDEIVAFSEVEKFLDTPVKRYSSGMYVRLAFSVAAHLEPEILIVDEVLAVGDAAFQKKCLGKMKDVSGQGRTVLFVSHNMAAVRNLCEKAILLNKGTVDCYGSIDQVVDKYLSSGSQGQLSDKYLNPKANEKDISLIEAEILNSQFNESSLFEISESVCVKLQIHCARIIPNLYAYITVRNSGDELLIESDTNDFLPNILNEISVGVNSFTIQIQPHALGVGDYVIYLSFASNYASGQNIESPGDILKFSVVDTVTERGHQRRAFTGQLLEWKKNF